MVCETHFEEEVVFIVGNVLVEVVMDVVVVVVV
jgi:hypothetical protein